MQTEIKSPWSSNLNELSKNIADWRRGKQFHTPENISGDNGDAMLGKLMLVVSEVGEASEEVRKGRVDAFEEEIADVFIRLCDICGSMKIDIEKRISEKMIINMGRPIRHGKVTRL